MGQRVDLDDLSDANGVAELLGLAHRNTVSVYQHRYPDMPRPVLNFGNGRVKVWLKPDVERWVAKQAASGRSRPARRAGGVTQPLRRPSIELGWASSPRRR
jgi:hypothetical protein